MSAALLHSPLPWVAEAAKYIGLPEIPGKQHNPVIVGWLKNLRAWWFEDETPWCGTFVAEVMRARGIQPPGAWYRAKAWATWGTQLAAPVYGCIVVFERKGGGHVGICVGLDAQGRLMVLGGNQGNRVSIAPFERARVLAYRWPPGYTIEFTPLPKLSSSAASSINEA